MAKPQLTVDSIANALQKTSGNVYAAAQALGVSRSAIYNKINKSAALREILTDARESTVDIAETKLRQLVHDGNITAIIFTLKTLGRERGYSERIEHTGANGGAIQIEIMPRLLQAIADNGLSASDVFEAMYHELTNSTDG